ncbi:MAG: DEAD/DEAH box helicase [Candidatus Neomarinimicrobiota bacterium]
MENEPNPPVEFADFGLADAILKTVKDLGYESPSAIQAQAIPHILAGRDLVGQAQTGTGKTAAFALPLLSRIDVKITQPQVLVLTPTRELAIQVAEAFQGYAARLKNFHILPIYGGQSYIGQLQQLKRGVQVVVGTPGRIMDHMRRGTLNLEAITALVLDEADEMLRMGFIDDVEWILEQTPKERQTALFSATMPAPIRKIARKYLNNPEEITIRTKTSTVATTNQRYWMVSGFHKLDALTRILEAEIFDAIIIFVRTKIATTELSEKLEARGFASAPLNGDIQQRQREKTIAQLKAGQLNILVATDVAARGLDVDRVSHVINYDIPYDSEAYIHRIGRTGRMGRKGEAILFVSPREKRLLWAIEKATNQKIELMRLPSTADINDRRIERFKQRITDTLGTGDLEPFTQIIDQYRMESDVPSIEIAAALAKLLQGDIPLLLQHVQEPPLERERPEYERKSFARPRTSRDRPVKKFTPPTTGMERFQIQVGHSHGVKPGNIVGAIANEAGLDSEFIGRIDIFDDYSTVDLPAGMPREILELLKSVVVAGQRLNMAKFSKPERVDSKIPDRKTGKRTKTPRPKTAAKPKRNKK